MAEDFFQLFNLPRAYVVDQAQLSANYRDLQRQLHPDKFANAGDKERSLAVQKASLVNDGFNTLKDPLARTKYLLQLAGVDMSASGNSRMPTEFLMQQMELRETLEAVSSKSDPMAAIADLLDELLAQRKSIDTKLAALFAESNPDLQAATELCNALQFFYKLIEEASELENRLEDQL